MTASKYGARTKKFLAGLGYIHVGTTEHWIPHVKQRRDLFGFVDLVALPSAADLETFQSSHTLGLQVTSRSNMGSRKRKIIEESSEEALAMMSAGWRIEVWGWDKPKHRWRVKRERLVPLIWSPLPEAEFDWELVES